MSILGFFEEIERGLPVPLSTEYAFLIKHYGQSGYFVKDGKTYRLTDNGREHLPELRRLPSVLASGFVEGVYEEIDI